jgi:hypothetical protein
MIGRHHTRHVSHRGWLAPHILRPITYFITAVTSPSFNRSAVLCARPPLVPYRTLCTTPLEQSPLFGVFNTLLEHLPQEWWNLVILEFKAPDMGRPRLHDVEKPFNQKFLFDWLLHLPSRVLHHLLNAHFISHFKGDISRLSSLETVLALARKPLCLHDLLRSRWRGVWQLDVALRFRRLQLWTFNLLTPSQLFLRGPR